MLVAGRMTATARADIGARCSSPTVKRGSEVCVQTCDTLLQSLGFPSAPFSWQNEQDPVSKNNVSPLKSGGREGIRTPGLLIANEESKFISRGAATTYVF